MAELVRTHAAALEERLLDHGAILFRGFSVKGVDDFDRFVEAMTQHRASYTYRSTPRTSVGKGIFTATEYPADQEIPLHNEMAYQRSWPLKVAFCCLHPAESGGETPIADMRRVSANIGQELLDRFEARGVQYIRHYRPHIDLPWQVVFQTDDRTALADFCRANSIVHEWLDAETLRTIQACQGVARHPLTGDRIFFNQAHLFHVSSLGEEQARSVIDVFGAARLPRHARFGDAQEIDPLDLDTVRSAFRREATAFRWQAGDILLADNMQVAHGRRPYTGKRQVLAALLDPSTA